MKVLVDTHCWLWWVSAPQKLNLPAKQVLSSTEHILFLSVVSSWEIAIKFSLRKLTLPEPPTIYVPTRLADQGMFPLPVNQAHALQVEKLPWHHKDPFDRLLVAQAQVEGCSLVSCDTAFDTYSVPRLW